MGSRLKLLAKFLQGKSPEEKARFFRLLHNKPSQYKTDPNMRRRITTGGEYEPLSPKDMMRLADQQAQDVEDFLRYNKLAEIVGGNSPDSTIAYLLEMMSGAKNPQRTSRLAKKFPRTKGNESFEVPF